MGSASAEHCLATPLFEMFSVSIHSNLDMLFGDERSCEIYGAIRVTDEKGNYLDLYNRSIDDAEIVSLGDTLSLTGNHCGIISLSTAFKVDVNFRAFYGGNTPCEFAKGNVNFRAFYGGHPFRRTIKGPNCTVEVIVCYEVPYALLNKLGKFISDCLPLWKGIRKGEVGIVDENLEGLQLVPTMSEIDERLKQYKFLSYLQSSLNFGLGRKDLRTCDGFPLAQVFSMVVFSGKREVCKGPSVVWPRRCFLATEFEMLMDIKADNGCTAIKGDLVWTVDFVTCPVFMYNRRISSILPGRNGYAAVHYVLLPHALQGAVKVQIRGNHDFDVYGKILGYYNDYTYEICYERQNYQVVLFSELADSPLRLGSDSEIPLSRAVLAVPTESCLVIECELWITNSETKDCLFYQGSLTFQGDAGAKFKEVIQPKSAGQWVTKAPLIEVSVDCHEEPGFYGCPSSV